MLAHEKQRGDVSQLEFMDECTMRLLADDPKRSKNFEFDRVFTPNASQR